MNKGYPMNGKYPKDGCIESTQLFYIVGGNPDGNGGGIIEAINDDRFTADRRAAHYTVKGYRDVRVMTEREFMIGAW